MSFAAIPEAMDAMAEPLLSGSLLCAGGEALIPLLKDRKYVMI